MSASSAPSCSASPVRSRPNQAPRARKPWWHRPEQGGVLWHRRGFVSSTSDSRLAAFRGAQVMITGGIGLIGSALARRLVELGAEVLLVDSMAPEAGGNLANIADIQGRVQINIADIRDAE